MDIEHDMMSPYLRFAEEVRRVANEIQYNVQAESDAILKYNNFKECVQNSMLDAELKEGICEEIDEIIAEELKHQNQLQAMYTELTGIVPEDSGDGENKG